MHIRWLNRALKRFDGIYAHLLEQSPQAATSQTELILDTITALKTFPRLGHPGRIANTREIVVSGTPYLIAYRLEENAIVILTILHGAQRWPADL